MQDKINKLINELNVRINYEFNLRESELTKEHRIKINNIIQEHIKNNTLNIIQQIKQAIEVYDLDENIETYQVVNKIRDIINEDKANKEYDKESKRNIESKKNKYQEYDKSHLTTEQMFNEDTIKDIIGG